MSKSSVVVLFYQRGIRLEDWSEIFDSTTMSGAARKAASYLRGTFHVITRKSRLDNYAYWYCEDIADLPKSVFERMLVDESTKKSVVDARPFFQDGEESIRMRGW